MNKYKIEKFPASRIATIDICTAGINKHHIPAFLEVDVTDSRLKIREHKKKGRSISFTGWITKVIADTVCTNSSAAAFLNGKTSRIIFNDVNISFLVEKDYNGDKVPIPLLLKKVNEMSIESITDQISSARKAAHEENVIVLDRKSRLSERLYYKLPGFLREQVWKILLKYPVSAFSKMGNVAVTSIGMIGKINGWFIPISVHPLCFGLGSVIKKPVVVNNEILIRDVLNLTVLMDHDIIDGAPMARFISELCGNIEKGMLL